MMPAARPAVSALLIFGIAFTASAQDITRTRFTVGGAFIISQPKEEFSVNVGNGYGANGTVMYPLLRSGSLEGLDDSGGDFANTTNYSDGTGAWVFGTGVRIPWNRTSPVSLDFGIRYHRGGEASYLREGSIIDQPDGSITITPLNSRTPFLMYMFGVQFRIPHGPSSCSPFLC
jgi:hypothetical protein